MRNALALPLLGTLPVLFALPALCTPLTPAAGDEPDCANAQTQIDMTICTDRDYKAADAELNAVWKQARAAVKAMDAGYEDGLKGAGKALLAAQRGWIAYRDGRCELAGFAARGGSLESMLVLSCLADMTRARTAELRQLIDSPEQ